jgi:hypothetical protein
MATQRIGESGPIFGTIDETFAVLENIDTTTDVEETELMDGDLDVIAVDQHTKRQKLTAELTYKASGVPLAANVGSGALFDVNPTDSDLEFTSVYLKSVGAAKAKGEYKKVRVEGTFWPNLGS